MQFLRRLVIDILEARLSETGDTLAISRVESYSDLHDW